MYLSAFLHRDEFFEIANRWLSNRLEPQDPLQITRIITYDSFAAWETLLFFIDNLLKSLINTSIRRKTISHKRELKDFICTAKYPKTDRIESLIAEYNKDPEFYYVGSPLAGYIYHDPLLKILSICRFKRVKRIAEKSSRYAKMHIFDELQAKAREISREKTQPLPLGSQVPLELLMEAEKGVMSRIKEKGIKLPVLSMSIKDILGLKVVDNGYGERGIESAITRFDGAKIVEKERHIGKYNAVHYIVELSVDFDYLIEKFKNIGKDVDFTQRGLSADNIYEDFSGFIVTGADTVQVDLIFTSFEELIESEIGRSMHENRIFEQRQEQSFNDTIMINIGYIIEYLFTVGLSSIVHLDDIPIKIWGRYLPDTLSHRIRKLYHIPEYSLIGV